MSYNFGNDLRRQTEVCAWTFYLGPRGGVAGVEKGGKFFLENFAILYKTEPPEIEF